MALRAEGDGGALRAQILKKRGRALRHFDQSEAEWRNLTPPWYRKHWGGRSLDSEFHRSGSPLTPIPAHPPARDDDIGGHPYRHFDRSEAEWRNLTPPWYRKHWGGRSLDSEFHRSGSPLTPIPAHPPARDDDIGGHPYRHFDRSEAEWRNLTPPWYRKHWGGRSLDSEFHRSGSPLTPIPAHPPARDDDIGGHPYRHFDRSGAEWRNLTPQWARKRVRLSPLVV